MRLLPALLIGLLFAWIGLSQTAPRERVVESIVPWLAYNSSCSSTVELQNLGDREVAAEVEAHKSSGALAPIVGLRGVALRLGAGEHAGYKLQLTEETDGAWVRIREKIPSPHLSPVLAVSGVTECLANDKLQTTVRDIAWPIRNPMASRDVRAGDDGIIALINASDRTVSVQGCYSSGTLYSVPHDERPGFLTTLCSETVREFVPPFGTRRYPVSRDGYSHFALTTRGDAIVLEMLRPGEPGSRIYRVDSTIRFGEEVSAK